MKQTTSSVTGMHCQSCVKLIELSLKDAPGVEGCKVDLASQTVDLTYDETKTSLPELNKKLQWYGYAIVQ